MAGDPQAELQAADGGNHLRSQGLGASWSLASRAVLSNRTFGSVGKVPFPTLSGTVAIVPLKYG